MRLYRPFRNRPQHRSRARVQSTYPMMRRSTVPRLVLSESFSQNLAPRGTWSPDVQRGVMVGRIFKPNRLPLLGLRSQNVRTASRYDREALKIPLLDRHVGIPATPSICQARHTRRRILFKKGVAGFGRKRSPGRDHTYKRTPDSETSCKRR